MLNMNRKDKLKRQRVTLQTKLEVIKRIEYGERQVKVCKAFNLAGSTVRSIFKNRKKILAAGRATAPMQAIKLSRNRPTIMLEMEKLLNVFIEDSTQRQIPLRAHMIQEKALSLYNELKATLPEGSNAEAFSASNGWFDRYKVRANLHNVSTQEEFASGDHEVPERFKKEFMVKNENVFWERMPKRTLLRTKSTLGYTRPTVESFEDEPILTTNRDSTDWEQTDDIPSLSIESVEPEVEYEESDSSASHLISVNTRLSNIVDNSIGNISHSDTEENIDNSNPPESSALSGVKSIPIQQFYNQRRIKRTVQNSKTQFWEANEAKLIWALERERIELMTKHEIELNKQQLRHNEEKHRLDLEILELKKQKLLMEVCLLQEKKPLL